MASYHLSVKTGGKGNASPHADYISRDGKYAREKDSDLEHKHGQRINRPSSGKPLTRSNVPTAAPTARLKSLCRES